MLRFVTILLFIIAIAVRSALLGGVAALLGLALIVTGLWTTRVGRALKVQRTVSPVLALGDTAEVVITLTNGSVLPVPWLLLMESVPPLLRALPLPHTVVALAAGGTRIFRYPVRAAQRGWYQLGPLQVRLGDVLGLGQHNLTLPAANVTVLPRVLPLAALPLPALLPFGPLSTSRRRGEDPARPAGVRPYQGSDGVRRIDWKATAHRNDLMVRRADPAIAPETTLALAFRAADYPARVLHDSLERAITATASLSVALLQRKLPVGLITNGIDPKHQDAVIALAQAKGDGQRLRLLETLGRLTLGSGGSLWEIMAQQPLPWGGTVVIVCADLTPDALPDVLRLLRRGQQLVVCLVEPTTLGQATARRYGIGCLVVDERGNVGR